MALNNLPQREEYLRKKRNRKLLKYGIVIFTLLSLIGLTSYLSHRQELRISKVNLSGEVILTETDLEIETLNFLHGSYLWLYPKNNSLWYSRKKLEKHLASTFRRIETINIEREGFHTLNISITERKPFAIWCSSISAGPNTICYFMDQNGTIFSEAPYFSGDAYFKYYGLVSTSSPIGSQYIASSTKFAEISNFIESVRGLSIRPVYLLAKQGGEFSLVLVGGGEIYFNEKDSLSLALQNLEALLKTPALSLKNGILPVDYIDLRYGNKLFYKLKS
jgi:cell division septal protein FtsQ